MTAGPAGQRAPCIVAGATAAGATDADRPGTTDRIEVITGDWATLRAHAETIRRAVFVVEQAFPESEEWDAMDAPATHAIARRDGRPIATGRLLPDGRIGRMAVLAADRGSGVGSRVLRALTRVAHERGDASVVLSSQLRACGFYARHGFEAFGDVHDDCGVAHRWMRLHLR